MSIVDRTTDKISHDEIRLSGISSARRFGLPVKSIGFDSYNQSDCGDVSQTIRLPNGGDSFAKVVVFSW